MMALTGPPCQLASRAWGQAARSSHAEGVASRTSSLREHGHRRKSRFERDQGPPLTSSFHLRLCPNITVRRGNRINEASFDLSTLMLADAVPALLMRSKDVASVASCIHCHQRDGFDWPAKFLGAHRADGYQTRIVRWHSLVGRVEPPEDVLPNQPVQRMSAARVRGNRMLGSGAHR